MKYRFSIDLARRIKACLAIDGFTVDHLFAKAGLDHLDQYSPAREDPIKMSDSPTEVTRAPLLGEHTDEVLRQLGYSNDDLALLRAEKVI